MRCTLHCSPTGAGEGNRTLVVSLEGFCSTIELHPRGCIHLHYYYQLLCNLVEGAGFEPAYSKEQIYSLSPLTTRPPLREEPQSMKQLLCPVKPRRAFYRCVINRLLRGEIVTAPPAKMQVLFLRLKFPCQISDTIDAIATR